MNARIVVNGVLFSAQYDRLRCSLQGFDSKSDFYSVYVANERAIELAAARAEDATADLSDSDLPNGSTYTLATKQGIIISVTLFPK